MEDCGLGHETATCFGSRARPAFPGLWSWPRVAGEKLHLTGDDAIQVGPRLQGLLLRLGVVYGPPAVQAEVVTLQCRYHLHTAVAENAVEVMLIALIPAAHGPVEPEAGLDCCGADEVVALAGQGFSCQVLE